MLALYGQQLTSEGRRGEIAPSVRAPPPPLGIVLASGAPDCLVATSRLVAVDHDGHFATVDTNSLGAGPTVSC